MAMKYRQCYWKDETDSFDDTRNKYFHYLEDISYLYTQSSHLVEYIQTTITDLNFDKIFISLSTRLIQGEPTVPTQPKGSNNAYIANTEYLANGLRDLAFYYSPQFKGTPIIQDEYPPLRDSTRKITVTAWVNNVTQGYIQLNNTVFSTSPTVPITLLENNSDSLVCTSSARAKAIYLFEKYAKKASPKFKGKPTYNTTTNSNSNEFANTNFVQTNITPAVNTAFTGIESMSIKAGLAVNGETIPPIDGYSVNECAFFVTQYSFNTVRINGIIDYQKHININSNGVVTCYVDATNVSNETTRMLGRVNYLVLAQKKNCKTLTY